MADDWTVRRMLGWMRDDFAARGIDAPRLDAEVLLAHALAIPRVKLYLDMDRPLDADELSAVRALVQRRRKHEPVAYVLGEREFYGRTFAVDRRVLIPRPDTETLIDQALACMPEGSQGRVLDLCTGSGCIGVTLAVERPGWSVDVTDASEEALAVARQNAEALAVADRMRFLEGDLWDCVDRDGYDLIAANPPYVSAAEYAELMPDVREHEPRAALLAEDDGLAFYQRIAERARSFLADDGHVLLEVGAGQAVEVARLLRTDFAHVEAFRDLGGVQRVVLASVRPSAERPDEEPRVEAIEEPAIEEPAIEEPAVEPPADEHGEPSTP